MSKNQMSFLPEDYVERRNVQRTNLICLTLFILVLGGVVGAYAVTSKQRSEVKQEQEMINAKYAEAAKRLEQLENLQKRRSEMLRKAQVTATLVEKVPRTHLLADLVNRMPAAVSLLSMEMHSKKVRAAPPVRSRSAMKNDSRTKGKKDEPPAPPPIPKTMVTLVMIGVAPTDVQVSQYMTRLQESVFLADVSLVFTEETKVEETILRKFRIEMILSDKVDVRELDIEQPERPRDPLRDNGSEMPVALPGRKL